MNSIPLSEPCISGNEWKYIQECLNTGWVSSVGSYVDQFEKKVSEYVNTPFGIATINGTSALHIALQACGIAQNDEVIVPTLTFIATSNAVKYCQADPIFMDCDLQTLCMHLQKLSDFLKKHSFRKKDGFTYHRETGKRIAALIPVHLYGHPSEMDDIMQLCQNYNIDVIEDAAESLGAFYKNKKTGSLGKIGCFSFNGNKIITSGTGGMVVTHDSYLAQKIRHLTTQAKTDPLNHDHDAIGFNYRLSNIQAALGVAQMEKIDMFIEIKRRNAKIYRDLLSNYDIELLWEQPWAKSSFWFYTIRIPKKHKNPLMYYLLSQKIQVRSIWKPNHTLAMYQKACTFYIEHALQVYDSCINLPCSVGIKQEEIEYVVEAIRHYFKFEALA